MTYLREATLFILTTAVHCCEPYETISIDDNTLVIRYASLTITTAFRRNPVSLNDQLGRRLKMFRVGPLLVGQISEY